ncbi:hypothetical protein CFC21_033658 [Triticum aestivum]|uniref:Uncharacterized protein n=2 Tax=Triticum aestivum TaxID=4565 RepID=A0A9R1JK99_WHEAT|nr:acyl transferase 15-like [Triticum aestivum]KAF7020576.1 hypothetical protein CFC21_033658 [Triticum aestivum]
MKFAVTQCSLPVLVGPSEPTPAGHLPLTSTDKGCLYLPVTSLHVFDRPIHEPAEIIRRALSHALVHYYPLAGRLDASGPDVQLACTGDGVEYVAATASCTLEDVRFLDSPPVAPLDAFVVRCSDRVRMSDCPLLMMQVTEFACGGYVVGATWNHAVADAFGMAQFLGAVGELARGLPTPSVVPVRHDAALPEIPHLLGAVGPYLDFTHAEYARTDVTIPWSFINRVKAEHGGADHQPCSTFDVVAAAVWRCRTRAMNADPASPALLVFTANVRRHIGAKDGYYGNCIALQMAVSTCGAVADGGTAETARLIRRGKERIPCILGDYEPVLFGEEVVGALRGHAPLFVSSWGGIGLDGVDFGGGRPARVMADMEVTWAPCCIPCLPCSRKDGEGVNVLAFCVREEHADGFHAELATLH